MKSELAKELRDLGDDMVTEHSYTKCRIAYQAAHHIETLEKRILELEGMLEDAEHFRDYWFRRAHPDRSPLTVIKGTKP